MGCKCVVFDMDGVLFDSESLVIQCWEKTAEKYNISDIKAICQSCLGVNSVATKKKFLEKYGDDFPYDAYKKEMSELYWNEVKAGKLQLKSGVMEILKFLKENDFAVGIASSTRLKVIEEETKRFGLFDMFDKIIGGDMVKNSKPSPEIYLTACKELNVLPEESYAVEDSYNGIRSASAAGMHAIMIPDLLPPNEEMEHLAEHIFTSMGEFQKHLQSFC
ncbi:MAG: HAD family phosphatase [Ruminococcus sp.]|nr:HAD family phosphatase [Ruminococcus sp.]